MRAASGLTRTLGGLDVFIYNVGLISIGLGVAYTQRYGNAYYPNCSLIVATLLAAILATAVTLGLWAWIAVVPRSGGIYVFLTRAGFPSLGFAISFVECIGWLYYLGSAATMLTALGIVPLGIILSPPGHEPWLIARIAEPPGTFMVASAAIWLAAWMLIRGMESFLRWQRLIFVIALIGTAAMLFALSGDPAIFHRNFNATVPTFGHDPYRVVISHAIATGWFGTRLGSRKRTVALLVWPFLALLGSAFSMNLGGEVRRPAKHQFWGMLGSLAFAVAVFLMVAVLAKHSVGNAFQGAVAYNHDNELATSADYYSTQVEPYIGYFACLATDSTLLRILICVGFICWVWFWIPGILAYASRAFLAWSLDRAAPKALAKLHPTRGTPYLAILAAAGIAQILLALLIFTSLFASLVFILAIVGAWCATLILGIVYPVTAPELFQESSLNDHRILGAPLMSALCAAGAIALVFVAYLLWRDPLAAGHSIDSLKAITLTFVAGLILHLSMRIYRRRQGFEIVLGYDEIPVE